MSAKSRASLALTASSELDTDALKQIVKSAAGQVKGGGASLLTTGIVNVGAQIHVEKELADGFGMSVTSGKRIVESCTFRATVAKDGDRSKLTVGGLDRYKTSQSTVFGFIPAGPKMIQGIAPYKKFLELVAAELKRADGAAAISIAESV